MLQLKGLLAVLFWDLVVEVRRGEAVLSMALFAVLVLFIASYGTSGLPGLEGTFGPLILWIAVLFAGTIGLSRAFLVEKENGALTGVLLSPLDSGAFYLAKVAATWLYVMAVGILLIAAYLVLFNFTRWDRIPFLLLAMGAFTLAYVAAGTIIAGMTSSLRGGEVVLRVLLFPIMIPAVINVLSAGESVFGEPPLEASRPSKALVALLALAVVYLSAGFVLFPKVVEE